MMIRAPRLDIDEIVVIALFAGAVAICAALVICFCAKNVPLFALLATMGGIAALAAVILLCLLGAAEAADLMSPAARRRAARRAARH